MSTIKQKLCDAQVGDTVVLTGIVDSIANDGEMIYIEFPGSSYFKGLVSSTEADIIPKPWEPKVGEEVDVVGRISLDVGYTILNIHGDGRPLYDGNVRRWATIAFGGDRPEVVRLSELLRRPQ